MSLWSRIANVFRGDRLSREIDEELQSHIREAIERGRDPADARKAFGSPLRQLDESHDIRVVAWLDSLRADAIFGWRQLKKNKVTSAAAILSLALAIGACTSAFRLIDALLLRPLPVAHPEQLYALSYQGTGFEGNPQTAEGCEYPMFRLMRTAVKDQAELLAISYANRTDLTYGSDDDMEKAYLQYVSGWMFNSFGLKPAIGRLLTEDDDRKPGARPYAVLSHDYWTRRFGGDPKVIGRTFRMGNDLFVIAGVVGKGFTGIEPGTMTEVFVPTMMNAYVEQAGATWFRTLVRLKPGVAVAPVREKLQAAFRAFREQKAKDFFNGRPKQTIDNFVNQRVLLAYAAAGASGMQLDYRQSLAALSVLVALVLLIACANVANLITAQAAARAREMALRVSIGAGRWRLLQLVLVECTMLAFLAAAIGGLFAAWSAPFVVSRINPPDNPARLSLPGDWRVFGFALALTLAVTLLFGLAPALRASAVQPASALKGGEDPHSRRRLMYALIGIQTGFFFLVLLAAGLFVASFDRLSRQPTGFSSERLLTLEVVPQRPQPPALWDEVIEHLRTVPGVEHVALSEWALLSGGGSESQISINAGSIILEPSFFLGVSPGWLHTMNIPFIGGRDFRPGDTDGSSAIVNEAFAERYFSGENPIGKSFDQGQGGAHLQIVGLVSNARYLDVRGPFPPVAYVPFRSLDAKGALRPRRSAVLVVRTSSNSLALAPTLRREVHRARSEFRVSNILTQLEINQAQTVRERLLAMLAMFFATVSLVLAAIGLYGVLDYSVLQRRREIGIRTAIGAPAGDIVRRVIAGVFSMVLVGAVAGLALGMASVRYIESLLYQVKPTDLAMLALPSITTLVAASLAAMPAVTRAVRIDPATTLRAE